MTKAEDARREQEVKFLQDVLGDLVDALGQVLAPSILRKALRQIGWKLGQLVAQQHRLIRRRALPFTPTEFVKTVTGSHLIPCSLDTRSPRRLTLTIHHCPFGLRDHLLTEVVSAYFGAIAAEQLGRVRVAVEHGTEGGGACRVTVFVGSGVESNSAQGEVYEIAQTGGPAVGQLDRTTEPLQPLSKREVRVLGLVGEGLTAKEIARAQGLSVRTVENVIGRIATKLGLRGRAQLIRFALRHRLAHL